jgi:hypothetical protein
LREVRLEIEKRASELEDTAIRLEKELREEANEQIATLTVEMARNARNFEARLKAKQAPW